MYKGEQALVDPVVWCKIYSGTVAEWHGGCRNDGGNRDEVIAIEPLQRPITSSGNKRKMNSHSNHIIYIKMLINLPDEWRAPAYRRTNIHTYIHTNVCLCEACSGGIACSLVLHFAPALPHLNHRCSISDCKCIKVYSCVCVDVLVRQMVFASRALIDRH